VINYNGVDWIIQSVDPNKVVDPIMAQFNPPEDGIMVQPGNISNVTKWKFRTPWNQDFMIDNNAGVLSIDPSVNMTTFKAGLLQFLCSGLPGSDAQQLQLILLYFLANQ
jgi:hypothetical protein